MLLIDGEGCCQRESRFYVKCKICQIEFTYESNAVFARHDESFASNAMHKMKNLDEIYF